MSKSLSSQARLDYPNQTNPVSKSDAINLSFGLIGALIGIITILATLLVRRITRT